MELFTARRHARRRTVLPALLVAAFAAWYTLAPSVGASAATASLSGVVFEDLDEDGQRDAGEPVWSGQGVEVWNLDETVRLGSATTDSAGRYRVDGLASGSYIVKPNRNQWWAYREYRDYHPQVLYVTTNTWGFDADVMTISGDTSFDLGWGEVTFRRDIDRPLSTATSSAGMTVHSYVDAVPAARVAAALEGFLVGDEAPLTTLHFGLVEGLSTCSTSVAGTSGSYAGFKAECRVSYEDWAFDRFATLAHEYGHAWANYHDKLVQQDGSYAGYLEARGLAGDSRLGSSRKWSASEMIAEDYRQLFGGHFAAWSQENGDIPPAADVPGLADYLAGPFMGTTSGEPEPATEPTSDPTTDPTTEPTTDPTTEPTTDPTTEPITEPITEPEPSSTTDEPSEPTTSGSGVSTAVESISNRGSWIGRVVVAVVADGAPQRGTVVTANWNAAGKHGGSGTVSCTTNQQGSCRLDVEQANRVDAVTFAIHTTAGGASATVTKP